MIFFCLESTSPQPQSLKIKNLIEVYVEWGLSIEDTIDLVVEHNVATCDAIRLRKNSSSSAPIAPTKVSTPDTIPTIQLFNDELDKKKRVEDILTKIDKSKYVNVLN